MIDKMNICVGDDIIIVPGIGETLEDLPFSAGTTLTLLEPCKEMYWYVAVNSKGKRGTVPITYLEVGSSGYRMVSVGCMCEIYM